MKKKVLKVSLLAVSLSIIGGSVFAQPITRLVPTHNPADVITLYNSSEKYPNNAWTWLQEGENAGWFTDLSPTKIVEVSVDEKNILRFDNFKWTYFSYYGSEQETEWGRKPVDCSQMNKMHIDVWTADETSFAVEFGSKSSGYKPLLQRQWTSLDIPLSAFGALVDANWSEMGWISFHGAAHKDETTNYTTVYVDNIYFYKDDDGRPTTRLTPTQHPKSDVISIFNSSGTYDNATWCWFQWAEMDYDGWFKALSPTTIPNQLPVVAGKEIIKFDNFKWMYFNYYGDDNGGPIDCSQMDKIHLDVWTADETFFAIEFGGKSSGYKPLLQGEWTSLDISIADFGDLIDANWSEMGWISFHGSADKNETTNYTTVYLDNFYFYKSGETGINTKFADKANIFVANGKLYVSGSTEAFAVYNTMGKLVHAGTSAENAEVALDKGMYIVKVAATVAKVLVK